MDPESLSPYFGDYPDGMYWSAIRREDTEAGDEVDEDYTVEGPNLRIMWDEGAGPLWASDGLLSDDPEWLRRALDLSDSLIADLLRWLSDMTDHHFGGSVADWHEGRRQLDERGRQLAGRLQAEVGGRYKVRYHA